MAMIDSSPHFSPFTEKILKTPKNLQTQTFWEFPSVFATSMSMTSSADSPSEYSNGNTLTKPREDVNTQKRRPPLYKVLLLNDDFTPMDFVVYVLQRIFFMDGEAATKVMLQVHTQGSGVAGVFPREIAETKVFVVSECAADNGHPLKCIMEVESQEKEDLC